MCYDLVATATIPAMNDRTTPHPNQQFIGVTGSLWRLQTPALVLDLDAFEANIRTAASLAQSHHVKLRPHAKSHRSTTIAKRQLAAGGVGMCVQTLGEAEVLWGKGVGPLLLASPIVALEKIARLIDLTLAGCKIMVVVDDAANVADFAAAAKARHATVDLLIDVDAGRDKLGVRNPSDAVALARQIASAPSLRFRGIQVYGGHVQHIYNFQERKTEALQVHARVRAATTALTSAGLPAEIVTGGGTGSFQFDLDNGPYTDLQIGSYAFMDVDYLRVDFGPAGPWPFTPSLHVLTTVISCNTLGRVTTDAGIKSFATDGPQPTIARGAPEGSSYTILGDEHGRINLPSGAAVPPLGQRALCVVPHCDPNVNLYDWLHVCRGDQLVELWPIDARGRSI